MSIEPLAPEELKAFVSLEQRARSAESPLELAFILANETVALLAFTQSAVLDANGKTVVLSGVSIPDDRSPFGHFLRRLHSILPHEGNKPVRVSPAGLERRVSEDWNDWLSPHALWVPPEMLGWGFLVARDEPFSDAEVSKLSRLSEVFQHARSALLGKRWWLSWKWSTAFGRVVVACLVAVGLSMPIRLTVLAPAEIVAMNPTIIRSPIDGIIEEIFVRPNEKVETGSVLVQLDTTALSGKLDVAFQDLVAAQAEYRQTMQLAITDSKSRAQLTAIMGRIDMRGAEVAYLRAMVAKARIDAPLPGIVIVDEAAELIGRPVTIGERILQVVNEQDVEIEAWVGLADAIDFAEEVKAMLVLNAEPLRPVYGEVRYVAYEAQTRPDGTTGYRLRARIIGGPSLPKLGMRGTLRLSGDYVSVGYWLVRRPLAVIRQALGV